MRVNRLRSISLLSILILVAALRVQGEAQGPPAARPLSIRILPQEVTLWGAQASQHFLVLARCADGLERDVTLQTQFKLSEGDKGEIDASGKFKARGYGKIVLTARVGRRSASATIHIEDAGGARPLTFARDITAILTKRGCNDTDCHGSVKGRNGFKLSVYALLPRDDYQWIVEGGTFRVLTTDANPETPRINLKEPEKSLLLLKPTFSVPHGGGLRFAVGSEDYLTMLNWIKAGAPFADKSEKEGARLDRVEVTPKEIVLDGRGKQQLTVTGYLSNGRREDLTDHARYVAENSGVADVNEMGLIEARRPGESNVFVRVAGGHSLSVAVGVVDHPIPNYPPPEARNYIDDFVFAKLRRFQILPSGTSRDEEFLRRVCLDLTGTLPPPGRVREFLSDKNPDKRDRLIEALLSSPEYVDYWSFRFSDLLRVSFGPTRELKAMVAYQDWVTKCIATNKPYDQMARERIASQGYSAPSRNFYTDDRILAPEIIMPEMVRVFWGRRIECAQCHNHPFETWTQKQFWELTAFFGGMTELETSHILFDALGEHHVDKPRELMVVNPRTKEKVAPAFLDGMNLPESKCVDPRLRFAQGIVSHPFFAEAAVNRIWSYFFGRGIVDPVDDFRSANPPTHPELLAALAKDFKDSGYDLKHLIRVIVQSRTYQFSGTPTEANKTDQINYSHAQPRHLEAAVLLDAITSATGASENFVLQTAAGRIDHLPISTRALEIVPDICPSQFLDAFGRSKRTALPLGPPQPNLLEALDMLAGSTYTSKITEDGGRLDRLLKKNACDAEIIDEFYLASLTRYPTANEKSQLLDFISRRSSNHREALADLTWALISSREFTYNH